jgi:hypothetical protein
MGNNTSSTLCGDETNQDALVHKDPPEVIFDPRKHLTPAYYECEKRMLGHTGIPWEEFKVHNVEIDD